MRNLKIGILADGGDAGGGRRHILTLCENLPSDTMSVCFFSLGEGALSHSIESLPNVPMKTHCLASKLDKALPKIILAWAEKENIDILHTHGLKANMYGRLALRKSKIPIITTYHSNPLYDYSSAIMGFFFSIIDQITLPMSSEYIGVSYEVATQLIRRGVQRNSINIVKNGVPLMNNNVDELSSEHRDRIRKKYNIPKDAFVVGSLGRLVPVKGYKDTIAVFAEIKKRYNKIANIYTIANGVDDILLQSMPEEENYILNLLHLNISFHPHP
jgi:glycosyltransferase involved in cell wall biosynthesis